MQSSIHDKKNLDTVRIVVRNHLSHTPGGAASAGGETGPAASPREARKAPPHPPTGCGVAGRLGTRLRSVSAKKKDAASPPQLCLTPAYGRRSHQRCASGAHCLFPCGGPARPPFGESGGL